MTFELLSPLDQNIELDGKTGLLKWNIAAETVNRLGRKIEIKFAVSDNDDGKTSGSLTLDLAGQSEEKNRRGGFKTRPQ